MGTRSVLVGCVGILFSCALIAADPAYVGQWRVNEEKSDRGIAMTFEATDSSDLRLIEGGRTTTVRFDGKDYPHPLGGVSRWTRLDDRTWETLYTKDGKVLGNAIYQLSADGQTLTTRPKIGGDSVVYRRKTGGPDGLAGAWSFASVPVSTTTIEVAEGYDLVVTMGGAKCKASFDGRDYPIIDPRGKPSTFEACRISKSGERGFSLEVILNGKPVDATTFTASEDGRTLTQVGGLVGQPSAGTIVHDRQ
ncbi:MAG TPA: hypothetical protein VGQ37_16830 [Vicinamibacterales bacterium]|jgi:hypothetical protein|nr:hypothetical protein [Vicinamibacterales bacterium]